MHFSYISVISGNIWNIEWNLIHSDPLHSSFDLENYKTNNNDSSALKKACTHKWKYCHLLTLKSLLFLFSFEHVQAVMNMDSGFFVNSQVS